MENYYGIIAIAIICVLVLLMGTMKQKSRAGVISTVILRGFVGAVGICIVNEILREQGMTALPGVNPVTVLTIGTLGISGFGLIYGILFYRLL